MRLRVPEDKKLLFELTMPTRWGDMDAFNHINNVSYFRFMECIRMDWLHSLGLNDKSATARVIILNAFCNFHHQLFYPDDLRLKLFASEPARKTFESWTTIERIDQPGKIYASGGATMVWVNLTTERAEDLPAWILELVS